MHLSIYAFILLSIDFTFLKVITLLFIASNFNVPQECAQNRTRGIVVLVFKLKKVLSSAHVNKITSCTVHIEDP